MGKIYANIYIASYSDEGGILQYSISEDGKLHYINKTMMKYPMYMIACKQKMYILLQRSFGNAGSGMICYDMDDSGKLVNPSKIFRTHGHGACHLTKSEELIYCTNYWSGNVVCVHNRVLSNHNCLNWIEKKRCTPHTHFVAETPDKRYLLVTDLGLDKLFIYNKDLTIKNIIDLPEGYGPRHLVFHESVRYFFCANELDSSVSVLQYEDGNAYLLNTKSTVPINFCHENTVAAIRCSGNEVYVSNRGHDSIAIFDFDGKDLNFRKHISTYGRCPRDFVSLRNVFICANLKSNNVTIVSKDSGKLLTDVKVDAPISVCNVE